ncbi:hypothetical protein LTR97_000991 [Elasticomyces elasticus]|uniref:DUF7587 domain-containing protein n=1 Tax=Elasticomyces elasticus TaxID=574655 RepID=A0AAN7WKY7_9PEZI|nr:hypothetical protein LTR97_000991 [Elasticomyces elasticus]
MAPTKNTEPARETHSNSLVHKALRAAAQHTPRYLFRAWSQRSGGDPRLNTPEAITPHAFLTGEAPSSIERVPADQIICLWNGHYGGAAVPSVFSSWSQSLHLAVTSFGRSGGYLSIIDTRSLPSHNTVAFTGDPTLRNHSLRGGPHEFLVYGIVSGGCHLAVSVQPFLDHCLRIRNTLAAREWGRTKIVSATIETSSLMICELAKAQELGELVGGSFGLAVTCQILSKPMFGGERKLALANLPSGTISELAVNYDVPNDWLEDIGGADIGGVDAYPEAATAANLMGAIAEHKFGSATSQATAKVIRGPRAQGLLKSKLVRIETTATDIMTAADPRSSRRTKRPTASSPPFREKVPRYMKELYIAMHGWDAAAAEVTTGSLGAYRGHLAGLDTLHAMKAAAEADTATERVASKKAASGTTRELRKLYIDMKGWKPDDVLEYIRKTHSGEYALLEQVAAAFAIKCELSRGTDCAEGEASCEDVEMTDCE